MNKSERPTVMVQGSARVFQRPTTLVLLGKIHESAPTLELALKQLNQKRAAVSRWLCQLAAEDIEFGEPRFKDQVEPDPMRIAQKMAELGKRKKGECGHRRVLVSYSAKWSIADKSSDEILVFVDRIRFEAADLQEDDSQETEDAPASRKNSGRTRWETDPVEEVQSMVSQIATPADNNEIHVFFLSSLTDEQHEKALAEAFRDGRAKGTMMARAAGRQLDDLHSAHWSASAFEFRRHASEVHRQMSVPLLAEAPLRIGPHQVIHESPRAAEFSVSVHLTFALK